ncbi:MAG: hypothetical protein K2N40_00340, partial [Ureaplasma sp.]|nr:hypothetical protein [Ureaplasma sp.]
MNKKFPNEYTQKDNLLETINFIYEFKTLFYKKLKEHWWLISVDAPIVEFATHSNSRIINFDNKYSGFVYQITKYPDNYLANFFKKLKYENRYLGLISLVNVFDRDAKIASVNYLNEQTFDLRIKVEESDKNDFDILIYDYYIKVVEIINKTLDELKYDIDHNVIYSIQKTKIINQSKNLLDKDTKDSYIKRQVEKHKCIALVNNNLNNLGDFWKISFPNDDELCSSEIWAYHYINKSQINLAQINFSKNIGDENNKKYYLHIVIN